MMTRTFHPIGQGAFYTEQFKEINVVYDCGTTKYKTIGEKVVKNTFTSEDKIDILFISHFHEDHISNIKTLKEHCDSIETVVLPVLSNIEKILQVDVYKDLGLEEEVVLIENKNSFFGKKTKIIYVEKYEDEEENVYKQEKDRDTKPRDIEKIENGEIIKSGDVLKLSKEPDWCFIPYNYEYSERKKELVEKLKNKNLDTKKIKKSLYCESKNRKTIREIYDSLKAGINLNSMLLYSGPLNKEDINKIKPFEKFILACSLKPRNPHLPSSHWDWLSNRFYRLPYISKDLSRVGCIYTGDTDLNLVDIKIEFEKYWHNVVTIQIPHHGSEENFNKNFLGDKFYYCPISAGMNNKYKHPHFKVIDSIISKKSSPIVITDSPDSCLIQNIINV